MNYKYSEETYPHKNSLPVRNNINGKSGIRYSHGEILENYHEPAFIIEKEIEGFIFAAVNDLFCKYIGYSKKELLQMSPLDIFANDTISLVVKNLNSSLSKNCVIWEGVTMNGVGKRVPVEIKSSQLEIMGLNHLLVAVKDISAHKKTLQDLQNHKLLLERAELIAKIGYWEFDLKTNKFWGSHGARSIYGLGQREMTLNDIKKIPLKKYRPQLDKALSELIDKGEKYDVEFEILRSNDNKMVQIHSMAEYDIFEKKVYGIVQNISDQKKVEKELINAKEKAEESDRLKSAFLSNMSHEIRTPMNGIVGFSQLLSQYDLNNETKKEYVEIINTCCNELLNVINDIVDISQLETGQVSVAKTPVNLTTLLNETVWQYRNQVNKKGLQIRLEALPAEDLILMTDESKLIQILKNLLDNAIRFTCSGFIELGINLKDGFIEFYVKDTGIGISDANHEKIFEPFRQAEINTSIEYGGTGMGLSITKSYVKLLGGEIWLQSQVDEGTIFYFTIPYIAKDFEYLFKHEKRSELPHAYNCLVVEDFEINFLYLKALLVPLGIEVLWAKNGQETLDLMNSNNDIDFVLMDIRLPDMDGYQVTRIIKDRWPTIPVIAQTANALANEKAMAFEAGCDDYITKPIYKDELIKKISPYISK